MKWGGKCMLRDRRLWWMLWRRGCLKEEGRVWGRFLVEEGWSGKEWDRLRKCLV